VIVQRHRLASLFAAAVLLSVAPHADGPVSKQQSDLFKRKLATIVQTGTQPASRQPRRTAVSEDEVNAYLAFDAASDIPAGVVNPSVTILGSGRVSGRAIVDLDAVRKQQNPTSLLDPASYLSGRLPITATGVLRTANGVGRFELEAATAGGVTLPKFLLQQIVSYYSRTPDQPNGIGLDDPFALPVRIREIQVERGQAIIVQ
jgi:hypothetical protein